MPVKWGRVATAAGAGVLLLLVPGCGDGNVGSSQVGPAGPAAGAAGRPPQTVSVFPLGGSAGQPGGPIPVSGPAGVPGGSAAGSGAPGTSAPSGSPAARAAASPSASPAGVPASVPAAPSPTVPPASPSASGGPGPVPGPAPSPSPEHSGPPGFTLGWYPGRDSFSAQVINSLPVRPRIENYYAPWLEPFRESFAQDAGANGIMTFVVMNPDNCPQCRGGYPSLPDIAAGVYDGYLTSFGQQIAAYGHPVMVTFAHEMNGGWYPWGLGGKDKVTPGQWIAAWDHVVTVVSAAAPGLVDWVWVPNDEAGAGPVAPYWPGDEYVDTVGIDGYLHTDSATFRTVFGRTIADIRALTSRPVWIAETGLKIDSTTGARLTRYVAAVRAVGIQGFLYFDTKNWVLSPADKAALAKAIDSAAG